MFPFERNRNRQSNLLSFYYFRYLQNQDHKLLTYNLMKMLNYYHIPVLQFVADGDARYRNHMLSMASYSPKVKHPKYDTAALESVIDVISSEERNSGWEINQHTTFEAFHYYIPANELELSEISTQHMKSTPKTPYSPDTSTNITHYLGLRCVTDTFCTVAPLLGGLPRCVTQDQNHWLRKNVKISLLACKPLRMGNYLLLFQHVRSVYELGPDYGLLKCDVDIHNKTDETSAEHLIKAKCINGMAQLDWSTGRAFFLMVVKEGFEAWWLPNLTSVERIGMSYYVAKVF